MIRWSPCCSTRPVTTLLISPSVRPSLRYSLLASLLALTNGRTASDEISCWLPRLRYQNTPIAVNARIAITATATTLRRDLPPGNATGAEAGSACALLLAVWVLIPALDGCASAPNSAVPVPVPPCFDSNRHRASAPAGQLASLPPPGTPDCDP